MTDIGLLGWPLKPFEKYSYIGSPIKRGLPRLRVRIPGNARISSASECLLTRQQDDCKGPQYRAEMAVSQIVGVLTWEFLCSGLS